MSQALQQRLAFPAPDVLLNANSRTHWAPKSKTTKMWRMAAMIHARRARLTAIDRVHIVITISFPEAYPQRRRDVGNYAPTAKAIVDGLVDAGVIPEDNDDVVIGPDLRRGTSTSTLVPFVDVELTPL